VTAYALCAACTGGGLAVVATHAADGTTRNVTTYCPRCGGSGVEPEGEK